MPTSPDNDSSDDDSLWLRTRPSLLGRARDTPPGAGRDAAWRELIENYRRPITVCLRRRVSRHPDADVIVAEFFSYLYSEGVLERVDLAKGRFRAFLQGVMRNYVLSKIRQYRGLGGGDELEALLVVDPPAGAEVEEERTWARSLLDRAVEQLGVTRPRDQKLLLKVYGIHPHAPQDTARVAADAGLSVQAVHKAVSRARLALRRLLEAQIAQLVDGSADYEREKRALIGRLLEAQPDLLG